MRKRGSPPRLQTFLLFIVSFCTVVLLWSIGSSRLREVRALRGPYGFTPGERWLPEMGGYRKSGEVYIVEKGGENRSHSWRVLSERNPRSLMCDNIVSDDEAAALIALAAPSLKRSRVVSHGSGKVDPGRTSEGVFLENSDPVVKAVRNRVSQLAMVSERLMERTQVLKYTEGQYYKLHPDYFVGSKRERLGALGQRVATVMVWLNHVKSGGETQFNTRPKSTVLPSRNSAILFYSVDKEGVEDSSSMHAALPPQGNSTKWVAVFWLRRGRCVGC